MNITDGRYVYMRAPQNPENKPLYQYTLMPTHMRASFAVEDFSFQKGAMTMKIENVTWVTRDKQFDTMLWDTEKDPNQVSCLDNSKVESYLKSKMFELMLEVDTPTE
ncbi:hypothetical protein GCM10008927_29060 [Amylibacter ulvae]|uniref:Uncharacterized protein n=1 Tax=Paramylibacter ulvae TaxID=1651968 RepID=A0ABQ3D887_9RHOB|nr:hypothetical protein [Amylibacter ulvae]GHA61806.1 hypothetical protein GCM10008927_29060 [Amylibacter ulvae]